MQLVGQDELRSLLTAAFTNNRIGHALMLIGPAGSGKKSWGRILAKTLLCKERSGVEACLKCHSCRSFDSGNHPGYYPLKPERQKLKTEQIRAVKESFFLAGSKKVCLIEEADKMTAEASSSLLKILEDPPDGLTFILLVEKTRLLPDTIISRCQSYYLRPLDVDELAAILNREKDLPVEKALLLARISAGVPGLALALADDEAFDERIEEAKTLAYNLAISRNPVHQLLNWAEQLARKDDLLAVLELLAMIYRDGLMQNLCRSGDRFQPQQTPLVWLEAIMPGDLEEAVLLLDKAVFEIYSTNVNRRLLLEKTLLALQRRFS
jgi:DNA polymerase III subunit delta'